MTPQKCDPKKIYVKYNFLDMDAVQCIIQSELSDLSPNVLDELQKETVRKSQLHGK